MRILLFPIIILFSAQFIHSQVTQEWVKRYPDTNTFTSGAQALALDDSGNVYVTGNSHTSYWSAITTIKYKSNGDQRWVANYYGDNSGGRYAYDIALDNSGNVYAAGYSFRNGCYFDYCTIKYNSNGVQQWVQYYDGPGHDIDQIQKIAVDNAGNIYVSGFSALFQNAFQCTTIKYSSDGRELWVQRYGTPDISSKANGILVDDNCNVYITGANNYSSVTLKYDSSGNQLWAAIWGTSGGTAAFDIALDREKNVFITGTCIAEPQRHADIFTIKYSNSGIQQWIKRHYFQDTAYNNNVARTIKVDSSGNVYAGGYTGSMQNGGYYLCVLKYTNEGNLIWTKLDTSGLGAMASVMSIDSKSSVYIAGSWGDLPNHTSCITIKYDSTGVEKWDMIYNFEYGVSYPYDILIDENYGVFITGMGTNRNYSGHYDFFTLKYSQLIGIKPISTTTPIEFKLYQNYPNPFNPSTKIKFEIPPIGQRHAFDVQLIIFDILGRQVASLIPPLWGGQVGLAPGTYEVEWDGSNYSSGIYFYKITSGSYSDTKKMILLK